MSCAEIMTRDPLTLKEADSVGAATKALIANHYINLPVVDGAGRFLGMFGIYDLLGLLVPRVALAGDFVPNLRFMSDNPADLRARLDAVKDKTVGECCDRQAVTLYPDTPEIEAIRLFCLRHTSLAVAERETGTLVGIVSYWDAIASIAGNEG